MSNYNWSDDDHDPIIEAIVYAAIIVLLLGFLSWLFGVVP